MSHAGAAVLATLAITGVHSDQRKLLLTAAVETDMAKRKISAPAEGLRGEYFFFTQGTIHGLGTGWIVAISDCTSYEACRFMFPLSFGPLPPDALHPVRTHIF